MTSSALPRLFAAEVEQLDPYAFMALLGKRAIHPGGRRSTEDLLQRADLHPNQQVLDVGCGVGTTAIAIARRFRSHVTVVDIAPLMLARTRANVHAAGLEDTVTVEQGDSCNSLSPTITLIASWPRP